MKDLTWWFIWVGLSLPSQLCYRAQKFEALPAPHLYRNRAGPVELQQRALTPQLVGAQRKSRLDGAAGSFNRGVELLSL